MEKGIIKILLVLAVIFMGFMYYNYDYISTDETVKIENLDVKTDDIGYVRLVDGNLDYNINFNKLGEEFIFSFDLKNDTLFDMNINKIAITGTSEWLDYDIYDKDGKRIDNNLVIKKNTKEKVFVSLKYARVITNSDDNSCKMGINLKVSRV